MVYVLVSYLSHFMISNIHPFYFQVAIILETKFFEENPISRWKMESVSRNDYKSHIPRALNFIIF